MQDMWKYVDLRHSLSEVAKALLYGGTIYFKSKRELPPKLKNEIIQEYKKANNIK